MLIDSFSPTAISELRARAAELGADHQQYLLVDGAFVPGLHRTVPDHRKALLYAGLPSCTDETRDVSPFLMLVDWTLESNAAALLRRCDKWPMLSVIETTESLDELTKRLAAWCIIETGDHRFNFRFPDARRLPCIYHVLDQTQRGQLTGPAVRWTYITRDGNWQTIALDGSGTTIADRPQLTTEQFALLVEDSRADEILMLLRDRGRPTYDQPARSHALIAQAVAVATNTDLADGDAIAWCDHFWKNDQLLDIDAGIKTLSAWQRFTV